MAFGNIKSKIIDYLRKNKFGFLFIGIAILIIPFFYYQGEIERKEIDKNGIKTIGKFVGIKNYPKRKTHHFQYYIGNKKVENYIQNVPKGYSCKCKIGKFYSLKYSEKYDDLIIVSFDEEITDTIKILNAGFKNSDL